MAQSIGRSMLVFFIVVVNQLNGNLGISLRIEGVTVMQQLFLQLLIVFDNTVVYGNYIAISTCMRMRISFGRLTMGCPSGMTDTTGTNEALTKMRSDAEKEISRLKGETDRELKERRGELSRSERRLQQKEENLDKKTDKMERYEEQLHQKHKKAET